MKKSSRRTFLKSALAIASGAVSLPEAPAVEPIERHGKAQMRLSISAYSYRDYLTEKRQPTMSLERFVDLAAELGFDAIEPTAYYFKDTSPGYLARLKGRCTRLGLDVSGGAVGNDFCHADEAKVSAEIASVKKWIERYSVLGAKTVRIFAGRLQPGDSLARAQQRCIAAIHEVCDHAGKYGIYLGLENHGGITTTVEQLLTLVKGVQHEWFGVNLDTAHFRTADPYADLARVAPYAVSVQLKTEIHRDRRKTEPADFKRLLGMLEKVGYRGYVALEYEARQDPLTAIPEHLKSLRQALASL